MEGTRDMLGQVGPTHSVPSPGGSRPGGPTSASTPRDRSFSPGSPFQRFPVPVGQSGPHFVGALEKLQQRLLWRGGLPHVIIQQEEFSHFGTEEGLPWTKHGGC